MKDVTAAETHLNSMTFRARCYVAGLLRTHILGCVADYELAETLAQRYARRINHGAPASLRTHRMSNTLRSFDRQVNGLLVARRMNSGETIDG